MRSSTLKAHNKKHQTHGNVIPAAEQNEEEKSEKSNSVERQPVKAQKLEEDGGKKLIIELGNIDSEEKDDDREDYESNDGE